jgi:hypothetical protein
MALIDVVYDTAAEQSNSVVPSVHLENPVGVLSTASDVGNLQLSCALGALSRA